MDTLVCTAAEKEATKAKLIEFLEQNDIAYSLFEGCGCDRLCIDLQNKENAYKKHYSDSGIIVQTINKDICRIYPNEILYIAIENRKSVLFLANRKIKTNHPLDYWKGILDPDAFAQPHHSFLVNLNYVEEITKERVKIKRGETECAIYTSSRKIGAFKKAFLNFCKQ